MINPKSMVLVQKIVSRTKEPYFYTMNTVLPQKIKTLILGGIITTLLTLPLIGTSFSIVNPDYVSKPVFAFINIFAFGACWLLIAFLIGKFPIYQVVGVAALLFTAGIAERYLNIQYNPITIPLMILFWLGATYFIVPEFFKKYQILLLSVYGLIISYYFFDFSMTVDLTSDHRFYFSKFIIMPIPVFSALWAYEQWKWLRTLKADKAKAELALLKSQINPHFFFNTLNNLYGLVVEKSAQAPEVVLKLSDMMRYTIYEGKEDFVSLTGEIAYLENYIELHKIRYQKKVDIHFTKHIEKDHQVAPLLFIILLENAFKHGVERMREDAYIRMDLTARRHRISFDIENNFVTPLKKRPIGIGLENLRLRLEHIYPHRHQLKITKKPALYQVQLTIDVP